MEPDACGGPTPAFAPDQGETASIEAVYWAPTLSPDADADAEWLEDGGAVGGDHRSSSTAGGSTVS